MQPYFLPYLGYFDLIFNSDLFIAYDTVQYIKQGWINRNRVLHPEKLGWLYIHAPLNRSSFDRSFETKIADVRVHGGKPWKQRILGQLLHYRKDAPFYGQVIQLVKECFSLEEESISRLNMKMLDLCAQYIGMRFEYRFSSELNLGLDLKLNAEERVLNFCDHFHATEYINLPGGAHLYNPDVFNSHGVRLVFRQLPTFVYPTSPYAFEPNLSIIDVLMWNAPEIIKKYLNLHRGN